MTSIEYTVKKLNLENFLDSLYSFFEKVSGHALKKDLLYNVFFEALGSKIKIFKHPFPGLLSTSEAIKVPCSFDNLSEYEFNIAKREVLTLCNKFVNFQAQQGKKHYLVWSETMLDDVNGEEEKAFLVPVLVPFSMVSENEGFTALLCSDTLLLNEDFSNIILISHHDMYALYDLKFADNFSKFIIENIQVDTR